MIVEEQVKVACKSLMDQRKGENNKFLMVIGEEQWLINVGVNDDQVKNNDRSLMVMVYNYGRTNIYAKIMRNNELVIESSVNVVIMRME